MQKNINTFMFAYVDSYVYNMHDLHQFTVVADNIRVH